MLKKIGLFSFGLMLAYGGIAQSQHYLDYIDKYKDIAIQEMERAGIPASIKLAQGILESDAGRSDLARRANNHFGIKCGNDWSGKTLWKKDDDYNDRGKLEESCFRSYRDPASGFRAHSEFLLDPAKQWRYGFLFQLESTDYRRWATGLKRAGYATSASYSDKLISLIETYELYRYDKMVANDVLIADRPTAPVQGAVLTNNDVKYVLALEGEMVSTIADRNDVTVHSVLKYNDHLHAENQKLGEGTFVYLQPLRASYRGKETWHEVQSNERMIDIALTYGVDLDKLYKRNDMAYGSEAAVGEKVKLKGCKVSGPKLRPRNMIEEKPITQQPVLITEREERPPQPTTVPVSQPADKKPELALPGWKPFEIQENEEEEYITFDDLEKEDTFRKPVFKPGIQSDPEPTIPVIDKPGTPTTSTATPTSTPTSRPIEVNSQYHEVQKGDTLWNISRRYGVSVDQIKQLNEISSNAIKIGQRLRVS